MKQQDVAILIVVIFIAGIGAFLLSKSFIKTGEKNATAEVVQPITPEFNIPSSEVFNTNSINPTVRIQIAPNSNTQPFSEQEQ